MKCQCGAEIPEKEPEEDTPDHLRVIGWEDRRVNGALKSLRLPDRSGQMAIAVPARRFDQLAQALRDTMNPHNVTNLCNHRLMLMGVWYYREKLPLDPPVPTKV